MKTTAGTDLSAVPKSVVLPSRDSALLNSACVSVWAAGQKGMCLVVIVHRRLPSFSEAEHTQSDLVRSGEGWADAPKVAHAMLLAQQSSDPSTQTQLPLTACCIIAVYKVLMTV